MSHDYMCALNFAIMYHLRYVSQFICVRLGFAIKYARFIS